MKTLKVTLKQHTPLIHFQHEQDGATLRASEVKPKLDRYIIERIGKGSYDEVKKRVKEEHKDWFIRKQGCYALDYKMSISAENLSTSKIEGYFGYNQKEKPFPAPMFFGNMERKMEKRASFHKKFFVKSNNLTLKIVCFKDEILDTILDYLYLFFMHTNFGTRQSKGYGSFSWDKEDWKTIMKKNGKNETKIPSPGSLHFTIKGDEYKLFQEMEWFYKAIRSGINDCIYRNQRMESIFYMKSLMFAYAKNKHLQWEKKTIKSFFYNLFSLEGDYADKINEKEISNHPGDNDVLTYISGKEEKYLFKDCLGLSTIEKWNKPVIDKSGTLFYDGDFILNKSTATSKKIPESVQRMKSPILLKPIKVKDGCYEVYILYNVIPDKFLKSKFYLSVDCCNDNDILPLCVYPDFSIEDYLNFLFKKRSGSNTYEVDIPKLILKGRDSSKGKRIIDIFNEIRRSYNPEHLI